MSPISLASVTSGGVNLEPSTCCFVQPLLQSSIDTPLLSVIKRPAEPFLQQLAGSNLCGLCVLNNLYQTEQFYLSDINDIVLLIFHSDKAGCNSHHENGKTVFVVQPSCYQRKFYYK